MKKRYVAPQLRLRGTLSELTMLIYKFRTA